MPQPSMMTATPVTRIVAGPDEHRQHDRVEGEALLRHAVAGAAGGEGRHQDRDHPDLAPLQRGQQPADAGVDRPGLGHHREEAADDQHEDRHVDGVGHAGRRVVEPGDRRHQHRAEPLRVRLDLGVGAGHRRLLPERLVHRALVLAGRNDPGQRRHDDDQPEEDGEGGRELLHRCALFRRRAPRSASLPGRRSRRTSFVARPRRVVSPSARPPSEIGRSRPRARRSPCGSRRSRAARRRRAAPRTRRGSAAPARIPRRSRGTPDRSAPVCAASAAASGKRATARASPVCAMSASAIALPRSETEARLRAARGAAKYVTVSDRRQSRRKSEIAPTLTMSTKKAETSGRITKAFGDGP